MEGATEVEEVEGGTVDVVVVDVASVVVVVCSVVVVGGTVDVVVV